MMQQVNLEEAFSRLEAADFPRLFPVESKEAGNRHWVLAGDLLGIPLEVAADGSIVPTTNRQSVQQILRRWSQHKRRQTEQECLQVSKKKINYEVVIRSRLGSRSEILSEPRFEKGGEFETLVEALRWIEREARVGGWRDFTLTTVGDPLAGIPVEHAEVA